MAGLPDYFGNFPFPPGAKKPKVITRQEMKRFIYPLEDTHHSDINWLIASTDKLTCGIYQLPPGATFDPPDIHDGDEVYGVLHGTLHALNPENGQCCEVHQGESILLPKGAVHKTYNFGADVCTILYMIAPRIWDERGAPAAYEGEMRIYKAGRWRGGEQFAAAKELGAFPVPGEAARNSRSFYHLTRQDMLRTIHGKNHPVPLTFYVSNDEAHMGEFTIPSGGEGSRASEPDSHQGDAVIYVESGPIVFFLNDGNETYEALEGEAMFLPAGTRYQCINYTAKPIKGIFMIAPKL